MANVAINRKDQLPELCVRCGQPRHKTLRIRFAKRSERDLANVMFVPKMFRLLRGIVPTISWSLPFCVHHSSSTKMKNSSQYLFILAALITLFLGCWVFATGHQSWPLIAALLIAPLLLFAAHHTALRPAYVTKYRLELDAVNDDFAEKFAELNRLPNEVAQDSNPFLGFDTEN